MATVKIDYSRFRRRALAPLIAARPHLTEAEITQLADDIYSPDDALRLAARRVLSSWLQASIAIVEELERCELCTPIEYRAARPRRTHSLPRRHAALTLTRSQNEKSK